ncbi:hypothetical protein DAPPUDRAFT_113916 [Daphnia pulex]|uniref:Uncharacterized protein n=1 Tax=Daphnia pulex TaxID=6669 RepID=E9HGH4_DAPPU|nr:hypothetical protein DAPPUDRAFT_113916 [Daphnia pulex]|eukprot:EFX69167.1 hypothetical protein DAPPUDRAFT_113916 [Daphnia pulex]
MNRKILMTGTRYHSCYHAVPEPIAEMEADHVPEQLPLMDIPDSAVAATAVESRDKGKESTPVTSTSVSALQQLRKNWRKSSNIYSEDVVDSANKKTTTQPQMDYRREVINSLRSRSASITTTQSGNPAGALNGVVAEFVTNRINNNSERNNNNNNSNVVAAQQKRKSSSNIYGRLAEITSEEESVSSPPPSLEIWTTFWNFFCISKPNIFSKFNNL